MDEATMRRIAEEESIMNFLRNNESSSYAHTFINISPENLEEFKKTFPMLSFEPSINGLTSVTINPNRTTRSNSV